MAFSNFTLDDTVDGLFAVADGINSGSDKRFAPPEFNYALTLKVKADQMEADAGKRPGRFKQTLSGIVGRASVVIPDRFKNRTTVDSLYQAISELAGQHGDDINDSTKGHQAGDQASNYAVGFALMGLASDLKHCLIAPMDPKVRIHQTADAINSIFKYVNQRSNTLTGAPINQEVISELAYQTLDVMQSAGFRSGQILDGLLKMEEIGIFGPGQATRLQRIKDTLMGVAQTQTHLDRGTKAEAAYQVSPSDPVAIQELMIVYQRAMGAAMSASANAASYRAPGVVPPEVLGLLDRGNRQMGVPYYTGAKESYNSAVAKLQDGKAAGTIPESDPEKLLEATILANLGRAALNSQPITEAIGGVMQMGQASVALVPTQEAYKLMVDGLGRHLAYLISGQQSQETPGMRFSLPGLPSGTPTNAPGGYQQPQLPSGKGK